jgi:hypothetical protein
MQKFTCYPVLLFVFATSILSCDISYFDQEIEEDIAWKGTAQLPVGYLDYTLSELFEELGSNNFDSTSSEALKFSYSESFSGDDDSAYNVKIADKTISASISTPITASNLAVIGESFPYTITPEIGPGITNPLIGTRSRNNQTVYNLNLSQEITRVSFTQGKLDITFTSSFDTHISLLLEIPSFTKKSGGATYTKTVVFDGVGAQTVSINLNDYHADLTHNGNSFDMTHNRLVLNLNADFTFAAGDTLKSNDTVSYDAVLTNVDTSVVYGDFKQEAFSISEQVLSFDFFDNFGDSDLSFTNPVMTLTATNDYGFPVGVDLSGVTSRNNSESLNLSYTGDAGLSNTFIIDGVANFGDAEKITSVELNKNNSNIAMLLEIKPSQIDFDASGTANPINTNPNENFYATDNEGLEVQVNLTFDEVSLQKMISFDTEDLLDNLTELLLSVTVSNKIPLTGRLVLHFKNDFGQTVLSETLTGFEAANVDETGASDGVPVTSDFRIDWDEEDITLLNEVQNVQVVLTLVLPQGEDEVLLRGSDAVRISIGTKLSAEFTDDNE